MKVVIVGTGRVGSAIATEIESEGHDVSVIDENEDAFDRLGKGFKGRKFVGVGLDIDVLTSAGLADADVCVASTDGDNTNVVVAQIAIKRFKVPCVVARVFDPLRAEFYRELGVRTLSPTATTIDEMLQQVRSCPMR